MKNSKRLVFYPAYCIRCVEHLLMKSLEDACPICKQTDQVHHTIKDEDREDLMGTPPKKTAVEIRKEFEQSLTSLQEVLVALRVTIKYMAFDLEATRRENATLKEKLAKYKSGG